MSKLNYFYSCCYLGIWVLCRARLCQQSLPSYSMWILLLMLLAGMAGDLQDKVILIKLKAALITEGKVQTLKWGWFSSRKILLVGSAVFNDALCVPQLCRCWGPEGTGAPCWLWAGQRPVQPSHVHNSSTPVPSTVHNPKCGQTSVQEHCLWKDSLLETSLPREELRGC